MQWQTEYGSSKSHWKVYLLLFFLFLFFFSTSLSLQDAHKWSLPSSSNTTTEARPNRLSYWTVSTLVAWISIYFFVWVGVRATTQSKHAQPEDKWPAFDFRADTLIKYTWQTDRVHFSFLLWRELFVWCTTVSEERLGGTGMCGQGDWTPA